MTEKTVTIADIVNCLLETYSEDGVAIALGARNTAFGRLPPIWVCETEEGRKRVFKWAESLVDM